MTGELYCENCLDTMLFMADKIVDLVVTSPPYDNLRSYNGFSFDFDKVASELYRILKDGGVVVWVVGDSVVNGSETGTCFKQALHFMALGFRLHDTMVYAKKNFVPLTHNRYEQAFEYMFVFSKGVPKTFNGLKEDCLTKGQPYNLKNRGVGVKENGLRRRNETVVTNPTKLHTNIFYYGTGQNKNGHPATFPLQLAKDHLLTWSNEGDLVYDPFAGSGTVGEAAEDLKRNWVLSEISPKYCDIIKDRLLLL